MFQMLLNGVGMSIEWYEYDILYYVDTKDFHIYDRGWGCTYKRTPVVKIQTVMSSYQVEKYKYKSIYVSREGECYRYVCYLMLYVTCKIISYLFMHFMFLN